MKTLTLLILALSITGCATLGTAPDTQASMGSPIEESATVPVSPAFPPSSQDQNTGPQIIIPATGGAPVIGIPLGGNIYLPVTGGLPVIGIPTSP
jgi:hypothetical protein